MAGWELVPCLVQLRNDFTEVAPNRKRDSDGSVGDQAHMKSTSDHNPDETGTVPIRDADSRNEVHAIDIDKDLMEPGLDMERVVQFLLERCRRGLEKRLRYIIWNRRIWHVDSGWRQKAYNGPNPHNEHAHFSASYNSVREADDSPWNLKEIPVALTEADKKFITDAVAGLKEEVEDLRGQLKAATTLTQFKSGGGLGSPIGNAVLGHSYPKSPGATRTTLWENLQELNVGVKELLAAVEELQPKPTS